MLRCFLRFPGQLWWVWKQYGSSFPLHHQSRSLHSDHNRLYHCWVGQQLPWWQQIHDSHCLLRFLPGKEPSCQFDVAVGTRAVIQFACLEKKCDATREGCLVLSFNWWWSISLRHPKVVHHVMRKYCSQNTVLMGGREKDQQSHT